LFNRLLQLANGLVGLGGVGIEVLDDALHGILAACRVEGSRLGPFVGSELIGNDVLHEHPLVTPDVTLEGRPTLGVGGQASVGVGAEL
jgi:hypothetical protein